MIHLFRERKRRPSPNRLREIVMVLAAYGMSDWLRPLRLHRLLPLRRRLAPDIRGKTRWELLRLALEKLGPTFVKFGQILSTREDLLGEELVTELSKLQDEVQPVDWNALEKVLNEELSAELRDRFRSIEVEPVAAASIAQVHRGQLADGSAVAIKIQRPGIVELIEQDIDILRFVAKTAHRHIAEFALVDVPGIVEEFAKQIRKELDFHREMQNILRFRHFFRTNRDVKIPEVHETLCTSKVLVMEFVDGVKLNAIIDGRVGGYDKRRIGQIGAEATLDMILIHGFFHADLHPGNILVLPDNRICLLDFGMTGTLNSKEQKYLVELLVGILDKDIERVSYGILSLIPHRQEAISRSSLERDLEEIVDQYVDLPIKNINLGRFIQQLLQVIQMHSLAIPSKFLFMGKALSTMEGVGERLYPDFNLLSLLGPVTRKLAAQQINPENLRKKALESGLDYISLAQDWPKLTDQLLKQVRDGKLRIHFDLSGVEPIQRTLEAVATQLIFGVVLAALMISSGLVVHAGLPPLVFGISLIGLVGFGTAGLMALGFLVFLLNKFIRKH